MKWKTSARIKKIKKIDIDSNTRRVYLPNYTNGVQWVNSNCITTITQMNPRDNVLSAEIEKIKIDDNTFDVGIKTTQFGGMKTLTGIALGRVDLQQVDYVEAYFSIKHVFKLTKSPATPYKRYRFKLNGDTVGELESPVLKSPDNQVTMIRMIYASNIIPTERFKDNFSFSYNQASFDYANDGTPLYGIWSQCLLCFVGYMENFSLEASLIIQDGTNEYVFRGVFDKLVYNTRKDIPSKNEKGIAVFYEQIPEKID